MIQKTIIFTILIVLFAVGVTAGSQYIGNKSTDEPSVNPDDPTDDWRVYFNKSWRFSLEYPSTWSAKTLVKNIGKSDHVIKEGIFFNGPAGPTIVLSLWINDKDLGIMEWFSAYPADSYSNKVKVPQTPNFNVAGTDAIKFYNPQVQAADELIVFFRKGKLYFRLEYRITDQMSSEYIFNHMLKSFK